VAYEVGPIARPEAVNFVESLPKTRSGKIMRRVLRARALGMPEQSRLLRAQALEMQERIESHFWLKDQRYYALGLDGRKRQIPSITSNAGHLLYARSAPLVSAGRLERRLMSDDMYSGWGIRAFSERHPAYNPLSYHNGTVWPHDNSLIVMGLCNYNFKRSAERVFTDLYEAALHFPYYRLPELFCGMLRQPNDSPVHYPVACTPQAWAAASGFMMLQGLLGIHADAPRRRLSIENPVLPRVMGDLMIHDMRVGKARVTLRVARQNERTFVNVVEQSGEPVRVTIEWE
jgi:glycogen debranching enzyme